MAMEPFELTLTQVNFDEQELNGSQDLHSFGDLVSYDSDLKEHNPSAIPVVPRRFKYSPPKRVSHGPTGIPRLKVEPVGTTDAVYYYEGDWQYSTHSSDDTNQEGSVPEDTISAFTSTGSMDGNMTSHTDHNPSVPGQAAVTDTTDVHRLIQETADHIAKSDEEASHRHSELDPKDSFTAFTETVEALALQKSVIGDQTIQPASADEIARVIAQTRRQLGLTSLSEDPEEDIAPIHAVISPIQSPKMQVVNSAETAVYQSHDIKVVTETHSPQRGLGNRDLQVGSSGNVQNTSGSSSQSPSSSGPVTDLTSSPAKASYYDFIHNRYIDSDDIVDIGVKNTALPDIVTASNIQTSHESVSDGSSQVSQQRESVLSVKQVQMSPAAQDTTSGQSVTEPHIDTSPEPSYESMSEHVSRVDTVIAQESVIIETKITGKVVDTTVVSNGESPASVGRQPELIRILPSEIRKEKAAWFGSGGPPVEKEKPKVRGEDHTAVIKDADSQGERSDTVSSEYQSMQINDHVTGKTDRAPNNPTSENASHQAGGQSSPVERNVELSNPTKQNKLTADHHSASHAETVVEVVREGAHTSGVLNQNSAENAALAVVVEKKVESEGMAPDVVPVGDNTVTMAPSGPASVNINDTQVNTSTPVRTGDVNDAELSSPVGLPVRTSAAATSPVSATARVKETMQREISSSNLSIAESIGDNRSRTSSMSSVSMLDYFMTDSPTRNDSVSMVAYDLVKQELDRTSREKAKFEGQIEMIESENKTLVKERAALQSQLAGFITQIKSQDAMHKGTVQERNSLAVDLDLIKQKMMRMELVVVDAQKLLEEKTEDLKNAQEEIQISQEANKKLEDKVKDVSQEVQAKEGTVQALKAKVAELYVECQSVNQVKIHAENEIKVLQSDVNSLNSAKDWYEKQVKNAQEAKTDLQNELTRVQGQSIAQGTLVEKLKADNLRMRQQLSDLQQKALMDKETLAQQLEAIEADILQRESQFVQLQHEKTLLEDALKSRPDVLLGDANAAVGAASMPEDVSEELRKLQNDNKRKDAQVHVLEREQAELVKRLRLAQESILDRDKSLDSLEKKYIDVETQLRHIQEDMLTKEEESLKLKEDKSSLEVSLMSAREEKRVIDEALQIVKADMGKVERTFKQMKLELTNKKADAETAAGDREKLQKEIEVIRDELEKARSGHLEGQAAIAALTTEDRKRLEESSQLVQQLKQQKNVLETKVNNLKHQLSVVECAKQTAASETAHMQDEVKVSRERLTEIEQKLNSLLQEKAELEGQVEVFQLSQTQGEQKNQELISLRSQLAELQKDSHREIAKQKGKALKLGSDLSRAQKEFKKKDKAREERLQELRQALQQSQELAARREDELQRVQERLAQDLDEQRQGLTAELQSVKIELEQLTVEKQQVDGELSKLQDKHSSQAKQHRSKVKELEKELGSLKEYKEQQQLFEESKKQLALELERERGKLAGIMQSHSSLKEHAHVIEEALAMRESSVVEMSSHAQEEFVRRDKHITDLKDKVKVLEDAVAREKQDVKNAKKQLMTEKGNHIKLRRAHENLKVEHDKMQVDLEKTKTQLQLLQMDVDKSQANEQLYQTQLDKVTTEFNKVKIEYEQLRREAGDSTEKEKMMEDKIKTMTWRTEQMAVELEAAKAQLKMAEDRHDLEVEQIRQTAQHSLTELTSLRTESSGHKHEKMVLQTHLSELRSGIRTYISQVQNAPTGGDGDRPQFDLSALERLTEDTQTVTNKSKPLNFLKATLSGLRGEISTLQQQVDEHTAAVQSSSTSWRDLEEQVRALREVCRTSAAERAATLTTEVLQNHSKMTSQSTLHAEADSHHAEPGDSSNTPESDVTE